MVEQEEQKKRVAKAALNYIQAGDVVGVGTGSTVDYFIAELVKMRERISATVASSQRTAQLLRKLKFNLLEPNQVEEINLYVDGADEVDRYLQMIKGGGGALTGEKIVSALAKKFICIADATKFVPVLGRAFLPIEVIPLARSYVARCCVKLGGVPVYREGVVTDYGNQVLDVWNLSFLDTEKLEQTLNNLAGVVSHGLFALRRADLLLLGTPQEVQVISPGGA